MSVLTSLASFSYSSISFSFSWFTANTLQILLAAVSAWRTVWLITRGNKVGNYILKGAILLPIQMFISRRTSLPALHQRKHGKNMIHRSWWPSHQVLECSQCLIWRQTLNHSGNFFFFFFWHFIIWNHMILQEAVPSASSILGMSRYFSATSKAVLRLPMGSSCKGRQSQEETQWRINR